MSVVLDIMVLAVVALTAFIGYRRGFVRSVVKMLGTVACVIAALIISDILAGAVYSGIVAPRVENALVNEFGSFSITSEVKTALNKMGAEVTLDDKQLKKALSDSGSLPSAFERIALNSGSGEKKAADLREKTEDYFGGGGFVKDIAEAAGMDDPQAVSERVQLSAGKAYDLVRAFATGEDNRAGVHYLVYNVIDGLLTSIIRYILFAVILIILEIIMAVILRVAGVLDHLPAISGANKTLGLMLGILKGVLYVLLVAGICAAIVKTDQIMDPQTFDDSHIFGIFFRIFY